jgi:hypothetical protein
MMTQVLRPQKCAKSFTTFCDMDSDRRISRQEWRSCVGLEENSKSSTTTFNLVFEPFCTPHETVGTRASLFNYTVFSKHPFWSFSACTLTIFGKLLLNRKFKLVKSLR